MGHDACNALAICTKEIDEAKGTDYHKRFMNFMKSYQRNDGDRCCAQTDSKGDRTKRPSEQIDPDHYVHIVEERNEGIVVSGMKVSITRAAYADQIFVIPTRALAKSDRDYAVAFTIPADYENVKMITRPVWHRERYLGPSLEERLIGGLGITEPKIGSDVANLEMTARKTDKGFVLNGSKMFTTNGYIGDYVIVAANLDKKGQKRHCPLNLIQIMFGDYKRSENILRRCLSQR